MTSHDTILIGLVCAAVLLACNLLAVAMLKGAKCCRRRLAAYLCPRCRAESFCATVEMGAGCNVTGRVLTDGRIFLYVENTPPILPMQIILCPGSAKAAHLALSRALIEATAGPDTGGPPPRDPQPAA